MWNQFLLNRRWTAEFLHWKNIPFSCNSLLAVLRPSSSLVPRRIDFSQTPVSRAFRQDCLSSYKNATSGSIVQCGNLHARQSVGSCDVKHVSRSGGCEFDLPTRPLLSLSLSDLILHTRHIRARFELPHVRDFSRHRHDRSFANLPFRSFDFTPFVVYWPPTRANCQNRKFTCVNNRCIRSRNIRIL